MYLAAGCVRSDPTAASERACTNIRYGLPEAQCIDPRMEEFCINDGLANLAS